MSAADLSAAIERVIAAHDWGTPTARRRGRDRRWPFVPVIHYKTGGKAGDGRTYQITGVAFETAAEAVAAGERWTEQCRVQLRHDLAEPRYRALREWHGLPRDLEAVA